MVGSLLAIPAFVFRASLAIYWGGDCMGKFRRRFTFANVMSVLALFVALGGSAYAATQLPPNSVGTQQIKDGGIRSADLGANSVGGGKVIGNSLTGADINESSLLVSRVVARPTGGTFSTNGLTTTDQTSYPLSNTTFTQRPNEIIEFVSQIKTTLASPSGSVNTACQVRVELSLDGKPLGGQISPGTLSDQPQTNTVATRQTFVVPMSSTSSHHTVTATAHLVDHSGNGLADACSGSSQIDSFALDVLGTR
jgi:hypothetical protein